MAKTTPNPPCTVTASWSRLRRETDLWRCCRRVTPTKLYRRAVSVHVLGVWRMFTQVSFFIRTGTLTDSCFTEFDNHIKICL